MDIKDDGLTKEDFEQYLEYLEHKEPNKALQDYNERINKKFIEILTKENKNANTS